MFKNNIILSIFILFGLSHVIQSQKCSVTIEGYHFDVSKLIRGDQDYQYTNHDNGDIYYFNICNNTVGDNPCGNDMIAYRYDAKEKRCYGLGSNREYYSIHNYNGAPSVIVSYKGGDEIPNNQRSRYELSYVFHCDPNSGDGEPIVLNPNEYGTVVVHWKSKYGCIAAFSQLIVNRDYDKDFDININYNQKKNEQPQNQYQNQQQQKEYENTPQNNIEDGSVNEFSLNNKTPYKINNIEANQDYNHNDDQVQDDQNLIQEDDKQINQNEELSDAEINDQQNDQPLQNQQDESNEDNVKLSDYQRYTSFAKPMQVKPTDNIESPYSPAFFEKVLPSVKDLDKLNMNNNNQKKYSTTKNDKQNDYLEILKNTYKEQNQFTPPEINIRNEQIIHKNNDPNFQ